MPSSPASLPSSRGRVVVIDDSATVISALSKWLEQDGFEVVALTRSLGATRVIMRVKPDVLLLDIKLPGLSGDRLATVLSQNPATASVPIIFYSEIGHEEMRKLAHECAVVGAIPKTEDLSVFRHEFEKLATPFLHEPSAQEGSAPASSRRTPGPQSTGIVELDQQHARIQEMLNRIGLITRGPHELDLAVTQRRALKVLSLELIVYMRFHLSTEDRYLREDGGPNMEEHRAEHEKFLEISADLERTIEATKATGELVEAARHLRQLVLEHMWDLDSDLASSSRSAG